MLSIQGRRMNYARRQQYRRLSRAASTTMASAAGMILALAVASAGAVSAAGVLLLLALGFGLYARHWMSLAQRSRAGARSEDVVRRVLALLEADGWRLRHSLRWRGRGDIDSLAIAPTGMAFVVETKTRTYDGSHLARVREQAAWLPRRRRRWCRRGAVPVVCLVRPRAIERVEREVLVVSIDRLIPVLRSGATGLGRFADELGMRGRIGQRRRLERADCIGRRAHGTLLPSFLSTAHRGCASTDREIRAVQRKQESDARAFELPQAFTSSRAGHSPGDQKSADQPCGCSGLCTRGVPANLAAVLATRSMGSAGRRVSGDLRTRLLSSGRGP